MLEDARDRVAAVLGCEPAEVVFTSGGTESDNLAVRGAVGAAGGRAVCSMVEHHAVLMPVGALGGTAVAVDQAGMIDLDALQRAVTASPSVVSVMTANNETGVIQPLHQVAELVGSESPATLLHTDAVQAAHWLEVPGLCAGFHLMSVSAHKCGGPKGTGALVVRRGVELSAQMLGGGQEGERRSGTQDVAGAVGLALALESASAERATEAPRVAGLRDRLESMLVERVEDCVPTASGAAKLPSIVHVCIAGVESEELLFLLERDGVMASAGSSCSAGAVEPSHVLAAMGVDRSLASGALRLSLGRTTTSAEVDRAVEVIAEAAESLRSGVVG